MDCGATYKQMASSERALEDGAAGLAAFGEKRLEDGDAVGGEDTGRDFNLMVEAGVGKDFEAGADGAAFWIVGAVNEAWNSGLDDRTGAHAARLDGDVEGGIGQAVVAEKTGGFAKDHYFRVSRGVIVADCAIAGTGKNLAFVDEHSTNGNFAGFGGGSCFC
jgi:hypothetical protein